MIDVSYLEEFNAPLRRIKGRVSVYRPELGAYNSFDYNGSLKDVTIERAGEQGKFFGFYVAQKLIFTILDKDRVQNFTKDNFFESSFAINENPYNGNFPKFYFTEAKRDENTNSLTVTADDMFSVASGIPLSTLELEGYTLYEIAQACANYFDLGLTTIGASESFNLEFPEGANFDGTESIAEVIKDIAEATQTICYATRYQLVFKKLGASDGSYSIGKQHYFTLENKDKYTLGAICHATELGNNVSTIAENGGVTQYVRDNGFWELREDIGEIVESAATNIVGLTINQFNCAWRGNFLVEIGDKLEITTKDNDVITSYLLNDTIKYDGGYKQTTNWSYEETQETASNPSTLGDKLKQTYAKVDKVNGRIDIVAQDVDSQNSAIASIEVTLDCIRNSVKSDIDDLETRVAETYLSKDEYNVYIPNEVGGSNYSFKGDGLWFTDENPDTNKQVETRVNNRGMSVYGDGEEKLTANDEGVKAVDLQATTYLIIGKNSRFEDFGNRTACFYIGGNS